MKRKIKIGDKLMWKDCDFVFTISDIDSSKEGGQILWEWAEYDGTKKNINGNRVDDINEWIKSDEIFIVGSDMTPIKKIKPHFLTKG